MSYLDMVSSMQVFGWILILLGVVVLLKADSPKK